MSEGYDGFMTSVNNPSRDNASFTLLGWLGWRVYSGMF